MTAAIGALRQDLDARKATIDKLSMENALLKEKLASCEDYVASLEQYSRSDNLIHNGIPVTYTETTTATDQQNRNGESYATTFDKVIQFYHDELGVAVTTSDISTAHRIRMRSSFNKTCSYCCQIHWTDYTC